MKFKIAFLSFLLIIFVFNPSHSWGSKFDIQLSYGLWSASPFGSLLERETENMIKNELERLMNSVLPPSAFSTLEDVSLSSSGHLVSLSLWYKFKQFSLGIRGDYYKYKLPYTINLEQSISFLDYELVRVRTEGGGTVNLNSVMFSVLARWEVLHSSRFRLHVHGGLTVIPYDGDMSLDQTTTVQTPVGDVSYSGAFSETVKNIRTWDEDIPKLLFAPTFGLSTEYDLHPRIAVFLGLAFAEGTVLSAGLNFHL